MTSDTVSAIAVLKAKPGKTADLRQALKALLQPTRQEAGNLDYALFQLRDAPDTFYMRESWRDPAALEALITGYVAARESCARALGRMPLDCLQETMEDAQAAIRRQGA